MGAAFLPWEKWIAQLVHLLHVAIKRRLYKVGRKRALIRSGAWPKTEGTVERIEWDSSLPREEIVYCYKTSCGFYSGSYWRWFELSNIRQVRVGDQLLLRYNPEDHSSSVFAEFLRIAQS